MIRKVPGKLLLDDKVVDFQAFEIRPKATDTDLERYYDDFLSHVLTVSDFFADPYSFHKAADDAADRNRAKLISREPRYPFLWAFRMPVFSFLDPAKRRLDDRYFRHAHCITSIPKGYSGDESEDPPDHRLREDISEKFRQYPGYEGIIEIPNDMDRPQTKSTTFNQAMGYVLIRYLAETGRSLTSTFFEYNLPEPLEYQSEYLLHDRLVSSLTDILLEHDPEAQFAERFLEYSLKDSHAEWLKAGSVLTMSVLFGVALINPYLAPLVLAPGRVRDYLLNKHKESMREVLMQPRPYPEFKQKI